MVEPEQDRPPPGLRREALLIGQRWVPRTFATAIPGSPERRELVFWHLYVTIACAASEVVVARRFQPGMRPVRLGWRSRAAHAGEVFAGSIGEVPPSFDPAREVECDTSWDGPAGLGPTTGTPVRLHWWAPPWRLELELVVLAKSDTRNSHGRWLVRRELREAMPEGYRELCQR